MPSLMYIYFGDWTDSRFLEKLSRRGIPHNHRIIKVYATPLDPRIALEREHIVVAESPCSPFTREEHYIYPDRDTYTGFCLEEYLTQKGLNEIAKQHARALFRFTNSPALELAHYAMSLKHEGEWVAKHPIGIIHGFKKASVQPETRSRALHLDLTSLHSLERLQKIMDINSKEQFVSQRETSLLLKLSRERES